MQTTKEDMNEETSTNAASSANSGLSLTTAEYEE